MKTLITLALILLSTFSFSQNPNGWIEEGAEWHHNYWVIQQGYVRHYLDGVETINDSIYQVVKSQHQLAYNQSNGDVVIGPITNGSEYKFYTSNDSVFIRKDNALQFVWHRNPQIGDIWDFGVQGADEDGNPINAYAIVQGFEPIEIAGIQTTDIIVAPCKDASGTLFFTAPDEDIDGIYPYAMFVSRINTLVGPRNDFMYIGQFYTTQTIAVTSFYYDRILCYSSNATNLHLFPNAPDCNNGLLSTNEIMPIEMKLFPNPTSSTFTITNPEQIKNLQILDAQGRLQAQNANFPFDVRGFSAGLYWVRCETLDGGVFVEKLIVE
jgi:hypothetical protein